MLWGSFSVSTAFIAMASRISVQNLVKQTMQHGLVTLSNTAVPGEFVVVIRSQYCHRLDVDVLSQSQADELATCHPKSYWNYL